MEDIKKVKRFGIDLGTTFSTITIYDSDTGRVETIPDEDTSQMTVPSAVYFPESGDPIIGVTALNMAAQDPTNLSRWIKMSMGEDFKQTFHGKEYTPEDISAEILKHMKKNAELFTGEEVNEVVVTVPAYFGDRERDATEKAIKLAGLKNINALLPEPSAAALAYAIDNLEAVAGKKVLVYDLGGGTFDATLIDCQKGEKEGETLLDIKVICKAGSRELGGVLWDKKLVEYLAEECNAKYGIDPRLDERARLNLNDNAIMAKHQLSKVDEWEVVVNSTGNVVKITKEKFEEITESLLLQTEEKVRDVLAAAEEKNIKKDDIDIILLAGGSSRMPAVTRMLNDVFNREPQVHRNLDLIVSIGAAYQAHLSDSKIEKLDDDGNKIIFVTPRLKDVGKAIGIAIMDQNNQQINHVLIPEGDPLDTEYINDSFGTHEDGQTSVKFEIYEGASKNIAECQKLGDATITDLPPGRPKGTPLKVLLKYNSNGIIEGKGIDKETGKEVEIKIERTKIIHKDN